MAKTKNFQNPGLGYTLLKKYVDTSKFQAYRNIQYIGQERIPEDGAIIYAPNHTNALMDAIVVLFINKSPKVFVARADIFKNPRVAKILTFLRIMPIMRQRDGIEEIKKNNETIERSVEVLQDKVPFCILPEGSHRAQHSLQTLGKGIFRIAIQAQELMADKMPLYIIPLGIEYGNFFRFRSTVLVQVGEPINVRDFISNHSELTPPELMNKMKDELIEKMKDVILYIPDDENYDAIYETCAIVINKQVSRFIDAHPKERRHSLTTRYQANRITTKEIETLRAIQPEDAEKLFAKANEIISLRKKQKISLSSIIMKRPFWSRLLKNLIFAICLPYTIIAAIFTLPITGISAFLFSKMKDKAFYNSVRFVIVVFLWPVLLIIYTLIAFCSLPWEWALLITLALAPAPLITRDAQRLYRIMVSDLKLLFNKPLKKAIKELRSMYFEIINKSS